MDSLTDEEKEELWVKDGVELYVNAIIAEDLLDAIPLDLTRKETNKDDQLAALKANILAAKLSQRPEVQDFRHILNERSTAKALVMRGHSKPDLLQTSHISLS